MADHDNEHGEESKGHGHGGGGHGHGPGGGHGEHEEGGCPEWMISFADNTALMMGLFVILLALNMGPKATKAAEGEPATEPTESNAQMLDFALGIREAFNNPVDPHSTDPREQPLVRRLRERETGRTVDEGPVKKGPESESTRPTEYSAIGGNLPFDDGSAILSNLTRQKLADIAAKVGQLRFIIEIRGHTAPSEAMRNEARSRQLSYERAMAVAQALSVQGVPWAQMRVVACGDTERAVARTYDRELERQNQRVEVILTRDVMAADPYTREVNALRSTNAPSQAPAGSSDGPAQDGEPVIDPGDSDHPGDH
ncbi:MAG: hypothetical protein AMXMBFR58_01380 [Phycisphaerae bacterium]